jgi:hypothetical protein
MLAVAGIAVILSLKNMHPARSSQSAMGIPPFIDH